MKNIVGLHSLRFFAFLAIFLYHSESKFSLGYLGADFFFVLSSFLLTLLALKEIDTTSKFNKLNFFMRRVLRVFPLYFFIVALSFFGLPALANYLQTNISLPEHQWMYWTFLSNYESSNNIFALKFLWTVAVEEQFYLAFIALSFLFKKHFWLVITIMFAVYFGFMIYAQQFNLSTHIHTLTHFSNFGLGMITAFMFRKMNLNKIAIICFVSSASMLYFLDTPKIIFHLLSSILFSSTIIITIKGIENFKLQKLFGPTEFLGRYTYGLYLFSGFVITFGNKFIPVQDNLLLVVFELALLLLISIVSYHSLEQFFLKKKKFFR
jgi:peptidoglycan/LPS O-acetylase OafA/YrhL